MASKKEIIYYHVEDGRTEETFLDVSSVRCLENPGNDKEGRTLIIEHDNKEQNTTRHNIDHIIGFEEVTSSGKSTAKQERALEM